MKWTATIALLVLGLTACNDQDSGSSQTASAQQADDSGAQAMATTCLAAAEAAEDFYLPPTQLPDGQPGKLIRCEVVPTVVSSLSTATRIMYLSRDSFGQPIAATGIVLDPLLPWTGSGERPLVGLTVGTHGQGDQCAPSRLLVEGLHATLPTDIIAEYETPNILYLLAQGIAVVVPDYQGLGTPDLHIYLNRVAEGQATIDAIRAAQRMPGSGIPANGPVGLTGYSQGGGAAGATAELLASYGTELNVVGAYVGAPTADPYAFLEYVDGTSLSGLQGYYLNGIAQLYPEAADYLDAELNEAGKAMRAETIGQCSIETIATYGFRQSAEWTTDGQTIAGLLNSDSLRHIVAQDRVGGIAPPVPIRLEIGSNDDIVPPEDARRLFADWCDLGATVDFVELPLPLLDLGTGAGHFGNFPLQSRNWLIDRFNGKPAVSTCPVSE